MESGIPISTSSDANAGGAQTQSEKHGGMLSCHPLASTWVSECHLYPGDQLLIIDRPQSTTSLLP